MKIVDDSEYVLFKAFSNHIKMGLVNPLNKLNLKCFKEFAKFEKQNALFLNSETYENLGESSKKLDAQKKKLIELLAVQDRIEKILKRNEQRLEFVNSRLSAVGIYNDAVDKKLFNSTLSKESKNIDCSTLNLNPRQNGGVTFKFFAGETLAFRDDVLDFSLEENRNVLIEGGPDFFHEVVSTFPYSVATIPDEAFMMAGLKNKILKECVLFVASKMKTQSIYASNKELGSLLENAGDIFDIAQYARELRNYFNVVVKQCIKKQAPELSEDADLYLKCYEGSDFLPASRRVSGAEMVVPEIDAEDESKDTESQKSESESVNQEQDADGVQESEKTGRTTEELLDLLLSDEDDDFDEEAEEDSEETVEESNEEEVEDDASLEIDNTIKELENLLLSDEDEEVEEINDESVSESKQNVGVAKSLEVERDEVDDELDRTLKELEAMLEEADEDDERRDDNG